MRSAIGAMQPQGVFHGQVAAAHLPLKVIDPVAEARFVFVPALLGYREAVRRDRGRERCEGEDESDAPAARPPSAPTGGLPCHSNAAQALRGRRARTVALLSP